MSERHEPDGAPQPLGLEGLAEPARRFPVRDAAGVLRATLVRTADKQLWWEAPDGTRGLGGRRAADLPLYGAERLRRLPLEVPVLVTEGPKDCEACWHAGLPAVGTLTGAGGLPSAAALEVLRDRIAILWPDHDPAGAAHMAALADALRDVAREVRVLDVAELPAKAGAADLPSAALARFVATHARTYARVGRVGDDLSREHETAPSLSTGAEPLPTRARVPTRRLSRRDVAALRAGVRLTFAAPGDTALGELVASFERIQGRVAKPAQVGYLMRLYRIHGPATRTLLEALYRERGSTENLLLALEVARPAWLPEEAEADEAPGAPWPPDDPGPGEAQAQDLAEEEGTWTG
ncbi:MAG: hypothetical protein ACP5VP_05985 [Candidatus Limnocylindrales bacterium]